ncbi:MAG: glycerol-3-phosphate acyltransferase [Candidatus Avoscillospira sp.]
MRSRMVLRVLFCLLNGYLLGSLSPAALLARVKDVNLRTEGTGNLGATNTTLVLGKQYGVLVMVFDVGKAYLACKVASFLLPEWEMAILLAGAAAVVGHAFPFYMKFRGGKGVAAFGGMILAFDPWFFLILLINAVILMLIVNYGVVGPMSASALFPVMVGVRSRSILEALVCAVTGLLIMLKHWNVFERMRDGSETKVRDFIRGK